MLTKQERWFKYTLEYLKARKPNMLEWDRPQTAGTRFKKTHPLKFDFWVSNKYGFFGIELKSIENKANRFPLANVTKIQKKALSNLNRWKGQHGILFISYGMREGRKKIFKTYAILFPQYLKKRPEKHRGMKSIKLVEMEETSFAVEVKMYEKVVDGKQRRFFKLMPMFCYFRRR